MLSVIVPARSLREVTTECLISINTAAHSLGIGHCLEWLLLDDHSEPDEGITDLFRHFKASAGVPVHVARFRVRQHYTGVFAYGLSRAKGDNVLFISNDMYVTPAWLRTVLAVSALDRSFGIVRGTAEIVDSFPQHVWSQPFVERRAEDMIEFAEYTARIRGLEWTSDTLLSGDAVLIRRELIEKIGVMDRRFFGYFGDPDYGLRARRAGFQLVCAKGAWLKHYGQGHIKAEARKRRESAAEADQRRMELVRAAWQHFRAKWDPALPETFTNTDVINWEKLMALPRSPELDYVAPVPHEPGIADVL